MQTDRLLLREWRASDLDVWGSWYADPEFTRYLGGPVDRREAWLRLAMHAGQWGLRGVRAVGGAAVVGSNGAW